LRINAAIVAVVVWSGCEADNGTWLFAMNMRVDSPDQADLREDLSIRSLRALGIISTAELELTNRTVSDHYD